MLSVNEVSTAHTFRTLSGREVFVMNGQADFDLDSLVAACHDARCRPPSAGGTGGSLKARTLPDVPVASVKFAYRPRHPDGHADPGEIVWAHVPFEDDPSRGKDRPVLIVGRTESGNLVGVQLTSKTHHKGSIPIEWGSDKASHIRPERMIQVDASNYRKEGAYVRKPAFQEIVDTITSRHGLTMQTLETDTETFACHDASCRPPTSGGTGGSKPSGAGTRGGSAKAKTITNGPRVASDKEDWSKSTHKPTEFGRKIRAAIDADPILSKRPTAAEIKADLDTKTAEALANTRTRLERYLRDGKGIEVSAGPERAYTSDAQDEAYAIKKQIQKRMSNGEHLKWIDDPNAPAKDNIEEAMRDIVTKRLTDPDIEKPVSVHTRVEVRDLTIGVTFRAPGRRPLTVNRQNDETITPEFEAASTRIGRMIHDEIKARTVTHIENAAANYDLAVDLLRQAGIDADDLSVFKGFTGTQVAYKPIRMVEKGLSPLEEHQKQLVRDVMSGHGVTGFERNYHMRNAETRAQQNVFREVMAEIIPMGGVVSGTPSHRTPKNGGWSGNEQVVAATRMYPTSWTELSNHAGGVRFVQTKGRAHYDHTDSTVTLDGSLSTAVHEIGHRYEFTVPGLLSMERIFHDRRTAGESSKSLRKLFPGQKYKAEETTYEDEFFGSYAGKTYSDGRAYELITMGMEAVTMGTRGQRPGNNNSNNKIDDDYAAFVLGAVATLVKP